MTLRNIGLAGVTALGLLAAFGAPQAHAGFLTGSFAISMSEGLTGGNGFATTSTNQFPGGANASFVYTGALNLANTQAQNSGNTGDLNKDFGFTTSNISNYNGTGTVSAANANYSTLAGFLTSSGSASGYQWGSWYSIDLGTLAAGTILTLTHDDGAAVYQNGINLGQTTAGPTTATTDNVTLASTADTMLYYSRQNGTPSILQVSASAVPEPMSMALLATGLVGFGIARRRRQAV